MGLLSDLFTTGTKAALEKRAAAQQQKYNEQNMLAQFQYNSQLQQQASQLSQEQWEKQFNMQNEYNSPAQQIQRMYDAHLNPLWNDQGGNTSGASVSGAAPSSSVGLPSAPKPELGSAVQTMLQFRQDKREERKQTNEDNKVIEEINNLKEDIKQKKISQDETEARIKQIYNDIDIATKENEIHAKQLFLAQQEFVFQQRTKQRELEQNAYSLATDRMNAQTQQDTLAFDKRKFAQEQQNFIKSFNLQEKKINAEIRQGNIKIAQEIFSKHAKTIERQVSDIYNKQSQSKHNFNIDGSFGASIGTGKLPLPIKMGAHADVGLGYGYETQKGQGHTSSNDRKETQLSLSMDALAELYASYDAIVTGCKEKKTPEHAEILIDVNETMQHTLEMLNMHNTTIKK